MLIIFYIIIVTLIYSLFNTKSIKYHSSVEEAEGGTNRHDGDGENSVSGCLFWEYLDAKFVSLRLLVSCDLFKIALLLYFYLIQGL